MSDKEKISIVEEILELEPNSLTLDSILSDYSEWDSLAIISVLAYFEGELGISLTPKQVKEFITVSDIVKIM